MTRNVSLAGLWILVATAIALPAAAQSPAALPDLRALGTGLVQAIRSGHAEAPSWLVIAIAGGCTGGLRGLHLVVGHALGQVLSTVRSVRYSELGALGWMSVLGLMTAVQTATLALVAAQA